MLKDTTTLVKAILERNPETRSDDNLLICVVFNQMGYNWNKPFVEILRAIKNGELPTLETVTRCRRKVQELRPDLRADKKVQEFRENNETAFVNYARKKNI